MTLDNATPEEVKAVKQLQDLLALEESAEDEQQLLRSYRYMSPALRDILHRRWEELIGSQRQEQ